MYDCKINEEGKYTTIFWKRQRKRRKKKREREK